MKSNATTRRDLLLATGAFAGTGLVPMFVRQALAAQAPVPASAIARTLGALKPISVPPPSAVFTAARTEGEVGPWGEVLVARVKNFAIPAAIRSADGSASVDTVSPLASVQVGIGTPSLISWTARGVEFTKGAAPEPWNTATIEQLIKSIASDPVKLRGMLQLRSALLTAFPVYLARTNSITDTRIGDGHRKATSHVSSITCNASATTEAVTTVQQVTETVWVTAQQQYQKCYNDQTSGAAGNSCSAVPEGILRDSCAAALCTAEGFVDTAESVLTTVTTVTNAAVNDAVGCAGAAVGAFRNFWNVPSRTLPGLEPANAKPVVPSLSDIQAAIKFLTDAIGGLSPIFPCLLSAKWSIASAGTPIPMGDGNLSIPYGIEVCLTSACADTLTIDKMASGLASSWTAAVTLLAALNPVGFGAFAASLGITVPQALTASVGALAALGAGATTAAALILAFIILCLIYGTAIVGQLTIWKQLGAFSDGQVCIVHPTFALAMIKILTVGIAPAELVPPIVIG